MFLQQLYWPVWEAYKYWYKSLHICFLPSTCISLQTPTNARNVTTVRIRIQMNQLYSWNWTGILTHPTSAWGPIRKIHRINTASAHQPLTSDCSHSCLNPHINTTTKLSLIFTSKSTKYLYLYIIHMCVSIQASSSFFKICLGIYSMDIPKKY